MGGDEVAAWQGGVQNTCLLTCTCSGHMVLVHGRRLLLEEQSLIKVTKEQELLIAKLSDTSTTGGL